MKLACHDFVRVDICPVKCSQPDHKKATSRMDFGRVRSITLAVHLPVRTPFDQIACRLFCAAHHTSWTAGIRRNLPWDYAPADCTVGPHEQGRFDHQSWAAPGSSVRRRCCRGWPKRSLNRIEPFQSAVSFRTLKTKTFIPRFNSTSATVSWSTT